MFLQLPWKSPSFEGNFATETPTRRRIPGFIDFADKNKEGPTAEIDYEELLSSKLQLVTVG